MLRSHRRRIVMAAGAAALALGASRATSAAWPKVGYLASGVRGTNPTWIPAFVAGLRDLGRVEGVNLEIVWRFTDGIPARLPEMVAELVAMKVDVIVAATIDVARAAATATKTIPIVMANGLDPVGLGLVRSLRRPGTNVTGLIWEQDPEITTKYVEFLAEAVPGLARIGCLIDPRWPGIQRYRDVFERAASIRHIAVHTIETRSPEDIDRAVPALAAGGAQAVFVYGSVLTGTHYRRILDHAVRHALPDISLFSNAVRTGALMSYGADFTEFYRRAAYFVDRILRGTDPGEIPIEMPSKYELIVNLKRAKALGLTLPASLLARADEVIE